MSIYNQYYTTRNKMKMNNNVKKLLFSGIIGLVAVVVTMFKNAYSDIDNHVISILLNGFYGKDNFCEFVNPVFCKMVELINNVFPNADGALLLVRLGSFLFYWWVAFLIMKYAKKQKIVYWLFYGILVIGLCIPCQNFTVYSASFSTMGIFTILLSMHILKNKKICFVGIFFIFMGMLGRYQAVLLTIPFFLLNIFIYLIVNKNQFKKTIMTVCSYVLPVFIIVCFMLIIKINVEKTELYSDAVQFNEYRSAIADYSMKPYDEIKDSINGVSENDYSLLKKRFLADTDLINTEYLKGVAEAGQTSQYGLSVREIEKCGKHILKICIRGEAFTRILFIISVFFLLVILCAPFNKMLKIEALLSGLGSMMICLYFSYIGRFLDRVCQPILLANVCVLLIIYITSNKKDYRKVFNRIISICLTVCLLFAGVIFVKYGVKTPRLAINLKAGNIENDIFSAIDSEEYYLWDTGTFCTVALSYYRNREMLPSQNFIDTQAFYGGWYYNHTFWKEKFAFNPIDKLLTQNSYYVSESIEDIQKYYKEHYKIEVKCKKVKDLLGVPVWKISETNND